MGECRCARRRRLVRPHSGGLRQNGARRGGTSNRLSALTIALGSRVETTHRLHVLRRICDGAVSRCEQSCSPGAGMSSTRPSAPRVTTPANTPRDSRVHHAPVSRFAFALVNQYCHNTVRTMAGGFPANGSRRNSPSTSSLPSTKRACVATTHGESLHGPSDANHRFHSNLGWYGA